MIQRLVERIHIVQMMDGSDVVGVSVVDQPHLYSIVDRAMVMIGVPP